jgi:hypothetical protein
MPDYKHLTLREYCRLGSNFVTLLPNYSYMHTGQELRKHLWKKVLVRIPNVGSYFATLVMIDEKLHECQVRDTKHKVLHKVRFRHIRLIK